MAGLPGLSSWSVVPLAHFRRGDRHVVVVWAAINSSGRLVDATVVGVPLRVGPDGRIEEAGRRWVIRDRAASIAALEAAIGGSDHEVIGRDAGVALDALGPRLGALAADFATRVRARDGAGAVRAAEAFASLLPISRAAHEPAVAQLLWLAAARNGRLEHVRTARQGSRATLTIRVLTGAMAVRTIRATAEPLGGRRERWVVTAYEE